MLRLAEDLTYVEAYQGFDLALALMDFGAGGGCGMYMREPVDLNAIDGRGSSQDNKWKFVWLCVYFSKDMKHAISAR